MQHFFLRTKFSYYILLLIPLWRQLNGIFPAISQKHKNFTSFYSYLTVESIERTFPPKQFLHILLFIFANHIIKKWCWSKHALDVSRSKIWSENILLEYVLFVKLHYHQYIISLITLASIRLLYLHYMFYSFFMQISKVLFITLNIGT